MNAIVSGRGGFALIIEDNRFMTIHVDDAGKPVPRTERDVRHLLDGLRDAEFFDQAEMSTIMARLPIAHRESEALDAIIAALDVELSLDTRRLCIEEADEWLADTNIKEVVCGVLCACPQPPGVDLRSAEEFAEGNGFSWAASLFHEVAMLQAEIATVTEAWVLLPSRLFDDEAARARARAVFVRAGLFRDLARAMSKAIATGGVVAAALLSPTVRALRGHRDVLQAWATALPRRTQTSRPPVNTEEDPPESNDLSSEETRLRGHAAYTQAQSRHEAIRYALRRGDRDDAQRKVNELVAFQRKTSRPEHLAKSLCNLAMDAKRAGFVDLQLEWTSRAVQIARTDGWAWAQYGDALRQSRKLDEALGAYEQALAFGQDVVAKTGRAEVLKALGKLDDALEAFERTMHQHPENIVAKTGRAEVLKAQGKLDDALDAYDDVLREYPLEVYAKAGRAEVLKAQGKLDDALDAYNKLLREHPQNVVGKNGRAEVLKTQGKLDDALDAYNKLLREHPQNVVVKNGRAEVLKAQGKLSDALDAYNDILQEHPQDVVAKNGRAEVLKAQGKLSEALAAYELTVREHPENDVAKNGRACVLGLLGNTDEALRSLPASEAINWVTEHIRGMLLMRLGRLGEAIQCFEQGVQQCPIAAQGEYFRTALAVARLRQRQYAEAATLLAQIQWAPLANLNALLITHASGALGNYEQAGRSFAKLNSNIIATWNPLVREIKCRYVDRSPPEHSDDWLINQEIDVILAHAA